MWLFNRKQSTLDPVTCMTDWEKREEIRKEVAGCREKCPVGTKKIVLQTPVVVLEVYSNFPVGGVGVKVLYNKNGELCFLHLPWEVIKDSK